MSDAPLCQILIPAPWHKRKRGGDGKDHDTEEINVEDLVALIRSIEESKTPLSEISEEIASQEPLKNTRLPKPKIDDDI